MTPLDLEVRDLRHRRPGALRDAPPAVSFRVRAGGRALVTGPNGSGKTTLLLRVAALLRGPGHVRVGDLQVGPGTGAAVRRRVGFLWQSPDDALLLPTVREDVAFGPLNDGLRPAGAREAADRWLEALGIAHLAAREIRSLSLGEKQMVSLAGVLARDPGLLLLDEPATYLDRAARERLASALAPLPATLLLVTHEPGWWEERLGPFDPVVRLPGQGDAGSGDGREASGDAEVR